MPFVTITLPEGKDRKFLQELSALIHSAMVDTINCPPATLYHCINELKPGNLIYLPEYKGRQRTGNVILLQITLKQGRTPDQKKAMYERITNDTHSRLSVRKEDLWIILTENAAEDWYFGADAAVG